MMKIIADIIYRNDD